jgi:DNA-binding winged helix-turn-helix (wHTH) protein
MIDARKSTLRRPSNVLFRASIMPSSFPARDHRGVTVQITVTGDSPDVAEVVRSLIDNLGPDCGLALAAPSTASARAADTDTILLDPSARVVLRGAEEISLCRREFDLLLFLARHPGQVLTRQQLLVGVWGDTFSSPRTVDVHVTRLRRKLPVRRSMIVTIRGVGYRFDSQAPLRVGSEGHPDLPSVRLAQFVPSNDLDVA